MYFNTETAPRNMACLERRSNYRGEREGLVKIGHDYCPKVQHLQEVCDSTNRKCDSTNRKYVTALTGSM